MDEVRGLADAAYYSCTSYLLRLKWTDLAGVVDTFRRATADSSLAELPFGA